MYGLSPEILVAFTNKERGFSLMITYFPHKTYSRRYIVADKWFHKFLWSSRKGIDVALLVLYV